MIYPDDPNPYPATSPLGRAVTAWQTAMLELAPLTARLRQIEAELAERTRTLGRPFIWRRMTLTEREAFDAAGDVLGAEQRQLEDRAGRISQRAQQAREAMDALLAQQARLNQQIAHTRAAYQQPAPQLLAELAALVGEV